jgi:ubiquinone biosynthesis protein UbiJ
MQVNALIEDAIKKERAEIARHNKKLDQLMTIEDETNDLRERLELKCSFADRIAYVVDDVDALSERRVEKVFTKFYN